MSLKHILENDRPILSVKNLVAGYGDSLILKNVSFDLSEGKILSIIGANGAGKSTLLKSVFGLVKCREGMIFFNNIDVTNLNPAKLLELGISYVMQGRSNFPMMTVRENLEIGAYFRRDNSIRKDIEDLLVIFPILREKQGEFAGNLSGGQQQILEMAMALMLHPKLMLIDEPSLGLSPVFADQVFDAICELNKNGTTIVLVEQNAKKALSISHKGVVLELGGVRQQGTGEELLNDESLRRHYLGG